MFLVVSAILFTGGLSHDALGIYPTMQCDRASPVPLRKEGPASPGPDLAPSPTRKDHSGRRAPLPPPAPPTQKEGSARTVERGSVPPTGRLYCHKQRLKEK